MMSDMFWNLKHFIWTRLHFRSWNYLGEGVLLFLDWECWTRFPDVFQCLDGGAKTLHNSRLWVEQQQWQFKDMKCCTLTVYSVPGIALCKTNEPLPGKHTHIHVLVLIGSFQPTGHISLTTGSCRCTGTNVVDPTQNVRLQESTLLHLQSQGDKGDMFNKRRVGVSTHHSITNTQQYKC